VADRDWLSSTNVIGISVSHEGSLFVF
jgi:hypothetical protein